MAEVIIVVYIITQLSFGYMIDLPTIDAGNSSIQPYFTGPGRL